MRMSTVLVLVVAVLAAALAYSLLRPHDGSSDDPDAAPAAPPAPPPTPPRHNPLPTTGTLVIRVKTPDSMPVPADTRAGYVAGDDRRLRPAAGDGTFRFSDAPLGRLQVVAQAGGYREGTAYAIVQPLVPTEVVVTLEPAR